MKIVIFADNFLPQVNGVVTAALGLARGIADKGHKVLIIAPRYKKKKNKALEEDNIHKNIEILRIPAIPAFFYPDLKITSLFSNKIYKKLKKDDYDLFHFVTPMGVAFNSIIMSRLFKKPLVGTFHTFFADKQYLKHAGLDFPFAQKLGWMFSNFFYNKCTLVTSPSFHTKKEVEDHGCKAPVKFISNGIDKSMFDNKDYKKIIKKYNSKNLVLFIGRIAYEKNIDYLLDCIKIASTRIKDLKLLIAGDGPQDKEARDKCRELGIEKNVVFLGRVPHNKLVKSGIFAACKVFASASKTENQPMTVLESQQNGIVCVALAERGMPDIIKDGYNGFLLKEGDKQGFADAIVRILNDEKLYKKMRKNTFEEVKKHNLSNVIEEWEKTYNSLIKDNNKSK